jgi:gamma-glutamyltranspeptidase/glutathione hydrolase
MADQTHFFDNPLASRRAPIMAYNVVATSQPLAAQAGLEMMRRGGNAVDAALAAAIALTVLEPTGNGVGGDGFAQVWDGHMVHAVNGSGRSPAGWEVNRFDRYTQMPRHGWESVTVPGVVSLWAELSARFGRLPFAVLCEPAIGYGRHGFAVSPIIAQRWRESEELFAGYPEFYRTFLPHGRAPRAGERFSCPRLAETLEEIALTGGESMYRGALAEAIAACAESSGAALSRADLANHTAQWVKPLSISYGGNDIYQLPPGNQGIALLLALGILAHLDTDRRQTDPGLSIHLQIEAMKLAFADLFHYLADPAWMQFDGTRLLAHHYLAERAGLIDYQCASNCTAGVPADPGTVCVVAGDESGMMVSLMQSNYEGFGSGIVIDGTGIAMHNRGRGFTLAPGHPNQVGGGKRPFHTLMPGLAVRHGEPVAAFGVMGAHMQAQGNLQILTSIFDQRIDPQGACDAPRWYLTDTGGLALEPDFDPSLRRELVGRGHLLIEGEPVSRFGGAQVILRSDNCYVSGSDYRKDGHAVGY